MTSYSLESVVGDGQKTHGGPTGWCWGWRILGAYLSVRLHIVQLMTSYSMESVLADLVKELEVDCQRTDGDPKGWF